jgi:biopolymer transport protein ExbB
MNTIQFSLPMVRLFLAQDEAPQHSSSLLRMIQAGGVVGWVLIVLSVVALTMIIMYMIQIRRRVLVPPQHVEVLDDLLARGEIPAALEYCANPDHDSYFTRIMAAGLNRYQRSAFGVFEIKNAVEEAGEEQTARLYRWTDAISVIGSISPLLGLLGTVLGIVGAFETLGQTGAAPDHKQLAQNISLALVCTLLGLTIAIPCMALFTFFRNRIDALAGEAGAEIERLLLHLEATAPSSRPAPQRGPTFVPRPAPVPSSAAAATAAEQGI